MINDIILITFFIGYGIFSYFTERIKRKLEKKIKEEHYSRLLLIEKSMYNLEKIKVQVTAEQNILIGLANGINNNYVDMELVQLQQELRTEIANENYERCIEINQLIKKRIENGK